MTFTITTKHDIGDIITYRSIGGIQRGVIESVQGWCRDEASGYCYVVRVGGGRYVSHMGFTDDGFLTVTKGAR